MQGQAERLSKSRISLNPYFGLCILRLYSINNALKDLRIMNNKYFAKIGRAFVDDPTKVTLLSIT